MWASNYITRLQQGETVQFRPRGGSMAGKVESGQLVTIEPFRSHSFHEITRGDIVLCQVAGNQYLHLVKSVDLTKRRVLICNARGRENGWTSEDRIFGKLVKIEP